MSEPNVCGQCGSRLFTGTLNGLCPSCTAKLTFGLAAEPEDQPGAVWGASFGDYESLEEIGRGGMGVIYKARQRSLNRTVAVKMILAGRFASKEIVQRFRAEAAAAAALQHPNIVAIHEVGETEGQHYFIMDYVEGRSLAEFVRDQPLPADRAARYVGAIADAVHYAHQRGILHRDLKPSNVLIDEQDQPRITDFGLAKRLDADSDLTISGKAIGSPGYMPPEQSVGSRRAIGPHSDVYSLGALLYHLVTGRPPFSAETVQATLAQVIQHQPVAPRAMNPGIPRDLETICLKCLEKDPQRRYQTAQLLADELNRFLTSQPILARPVSAFGKTWRWCRRNPVVASWALTAAALFLFGVLGVVWQWRRAERHGRSESIERTRAQRMLTQLELQRAEDLLQKNEAAKALAHLAHVLRNDPSNLTVAERLISVLTYRSFPLRMTPPLRHGAAVSELVFSPDGQWIATASKDQTARVWDARTGEPRTPPLPHSGSVNSIRFSPDRTRIVTASRDKTARVWTTGTNASPVQSFLHSNEVLSAEFSPQGDCVITGSSDGAVRIWKTSSGDLKFELKHGSEISGAHFSADSQRVLTAGHIDGEVKVWSADTGQLQHTLKVPGWVESLRSSPDGKRLALASYHHFGQLWDLPSGTLIATLPHKGAVQDAVFSPDGELLVTVSRDRHAALWDARRGRLVHELPIHQTWIMSAEFSADGLCLLTVEASGRAYVWDLLSGRLVTEPIQSSGKLAAAALNPMGSRVAVAGEEGSTEIFDVYPGQAQAMVLPHRDLVNESRFTADGAQVLTASRDGTARLWNRQTGAAQGTFGQNGPIRAAAVSADGRRVLTGGMDNTAGVWNRDTGSNLVTVRHQAQVSTVEFSSDGAFFLTASFDGTARTWRTSSGEPLAPTPIPHQQRLWQAGLSPDGTLVLTAPEETTARLWDARTGRPHSPALSHDGSVEFAGFSRDGERVITASADMSARIWDARTGALLVKISHGGPVACAQFSPEGSRVVTASRDNTARVWDARTGQPLTEPMRHQAPLYFAEFSPDGWRVVTAALDETARLWDAATGKPLSESLPLSGRARRTCFSPDGRWLLAGARHGRLWDLFPVDEAAPSWLPVLAEAVAGLHWTASGFEEPVDPSVVIEFKRQLTDKPANDRFAFWAKWFLADRLTRAVSPFSKASAAATKQQLANDESLPGIWERLRLAPDNGLAWARLAKLVRQQEPFDNPHKESQAEVFGRRALALGAQETEVWPNSAEILQQTGDTNAPLAAVLPPRDPLTSANCIDLSRYYNGGLHQDWHETPITRKGWNFKRLSLGRQTFGGVEFDVRGLIQLSGQAIAQDLPRFPVELLGIPVGRRCHALQFLHASIWAKHVPVGTRLGNYLVRYTDGQNVEIPIIHGEDMLEWQILQDDVSELTRATVVWRGKTPHNFPIRLFKRPWDNARPDVPIKSIDFQSAMSFAAPFLVAITADP